MQHFPADPPFLLTDAAAPSVPILLCRKAGGDLSRRLAREGAGALASLTADAQAARSTGNAWSTARYRTMAAMVRALYGPPVGPGH